MHFLVTSQGRKEGVLDLSEGLSPLLSSTPPTPVPPEVQSRKGWDFPEGPNRGTLDMPRRGCCASSPTLLWLPLGGGCPRESHADLAGEQPHPRYPKDAGGCSWGLPEGPAKIVQPLQESLRCPLGPPLALGWRESPGLAPRSLRWAPAGNPGLLQGGSWAESSPMFLAPGCSWARNGRLGGALLWVREGRRGLGNGARGRRGPAPPREEGQLLFPKGLGGDPCTAASSLPPLSPCRKPTWC